MENIVCSGMFSSYLGRIFGTVSASHTVFYLLVTIYQTWHLNTTVQILGVRMRHYLEAVFFGLWSYSQSKTKSIYNHSKSWVYTELWTFLYFSFASAKMGIIILVYLLELLQKKKKMIKTIVKDNHL